MSTKTTFKRIALVVVAALGFGLLSVAPSSATVQSDTLAISATSNATSVDNNTAASTTLTQTFLGVAGDTMTATVSLVSGPTGNTTVPTLTPILGTGVNTVPSVSGLVGTIADTATSFSAYLLVSGQWTLGLPATTLAGTYVIKVTPGITSGTTTPTAAAVTWTVTVGAIATAAAPDSTSTSFMVPGAVASVSASSTVAVAAGAGAIATIKVNPLVAGVAATGSLTLSVTVTGPGTLSTPVQTGTTTPTTSGLKTTSLSGVAGGVFYVYLFGDGISGTSTITATLGTVVFTHTAINYGAAASAVATVVKPVITSGSGATAVATVTALIKDAGGNIVPNANFWLVSGTPAVFASGTAAVVSSATGVATFNILGLTAGTSTVTIQNVAAGSTATISAAAVSVRAGSNVASSVAMSFDKATYTPGELATVTVVIKDAAGNTVADGVHAAFAAAVTSTRALAAGTLPTASLTTGSSTGTLTFSVNAPATAGDFTISALGGAGLAAAQAGLVISATATVAVDTSATDAATDAANEATDAANAALDAANAAAEAADAATAAAQDAADAVAALSVQVATLIASLRAQIRSLTNLVIRIQKKLNKKKK